jgi:hypothetical protein
MIDDKGVLERIWPPQPFSLLSAVGSLHPSCLTLSCLVLATGVHAVRPDNWKPMRHLVPRVCPNGWACSSRAEQAVLWCLRQDRLLNPQWSSRGGVKPHWCSALTGVLMPRRSQPLAFRFFSSFPSFTIHTTFLSPATKSATAKEPSKARTTKHGRHGRFGWEPRQRSPE